MLRKKIMIPLTAVAIGGTALLGTGAVFAQSNTANPYSGLVQAIAQKFHLNPADVQAVANQYRNQQRVNFKHNMLQRLEQRLNNLVSQGKITSNQKSAIETELTQLKAKYFTNLQNLTPQQRKQNMKGLQADWQNWAKSQGIDPTIIRVGFVRGMQRMNGWPSRSTSPVPSAS